VDSNDAQHLAEVLRILQEADGWAARISAEENKARPAPKSPLCGDDKQAHPYQVSHAAWHSLSTAVDHLICLKALLGDAQLIPMFAPFTLDRAALENSCVAVWMLHPPGRDDRLTRRLQLAIDDIHNGEQAKALTGQQGGRPEAERIAQVVAIAAKAGIDKAAVTRKAPYWQIVKAADEAAGSSGRYEVSWKLCSAYTHGDFWATLASLRRTEVRDSGQPGVGTFKVEADLRLLAQVTAIAVSATRQGWGLYDQRCRPPY
jgi:hypothetical protein